MGKLGLRNRFICFLGSILLPAAIALAGTESYDYKAEATPPPQPWCETPPTLEIRIRVPGRLAGVSGDSGVKGVVVSSDVGVDHARRALGRKAHS